MPVDTSIYGRLGGSVPLEMPLDQLGKGMQIKNLMGQGELQGLQIGETRRGIEEQQRLRDLFAGGLPKPEQVYAVSPQMGASYAKSQAEQRSAQANLLKQDSDLIKSFGEQAKNELLNVTDQPSWDKYRALQKQRASLLSTPQFQEVAMQALQKDPEVFDPAVIQAKLAGEAPVPPGHTRMPGGRLSPVDPNYLAGQTAIAEAKRPQTNVTTNILPPSPGMDAADKKFAEEYVAFKAAGGFADTQKQLNQLRDVRAQLVAGKERTGPITGRTPDAVLSVLNPGAMAARDAVEEVVQRNLRLILGAQFTEREGERLIARAYNINLPEEENTKRLDRLIKQIEDAAKAKEDAANYFERNGTLRGWQGKLYTVSDFERLDFGNPTKSTPKASASKPAAAGKPKFLGFE